MTVEWFDEQFTNLSFGYQFMTIILDIGSTEIASAIRLT